MSAFNISFIFATFQVEDAHVMWYSTETKAAQIGLTTMFLVLRITDIAGNAIVCLLIIKFKDMRLVIGKAFTKRNNCYDKGMRIVKFAGHGYDKSKYEIAF